MDLTPDELAGISDLFGGLTPTELHEAIENVAARQGMTFDPGDLDERIEAARREYYLLTVEHEGATLLAPGPAALPSLPNHAEDLPHMMDVPERAIDPERLANAAREQLSDDARQAISESDRDRTEFLVDVCYDVEALGPVEVDPIRERLLDSLEAS
ncbi:MAG: hypothetical protein ABEH88_12450 [Halobacteriales archaeon]